MFVVVCTLTVCGDCVSEVSSGGYQGQINPLCAESACSHPAACGCGLSLDGYMLLLVASLSSTGQLLCLRLFLPGGFFNVEAGGGGSCWMLMYRK